VFERIAKLRRRSPPIRTVAAVGGPVPGGAYELALACGTIVAAESRETKIGLPETQLGILPAWGGTTRLPRRVGSARARGDPLRPAPRRPRGVREGLVDRLAYPEDLLRHRVRPRGRAHSVSKRCAAGSPRRRQESARGEFVAKQARKQVMLRTRGQYPAPLAAIDIVARSPRTSTEASFAAEAQAASALAVGPVCKSLIGSSAPRGREEARSRADGRPRRVRSGRRARRGRHGTRIASLLAERGLRTRIFDVAPGALDAASSSTARRSPSACAAGARTRARRWRRSTRSTSRARSRASRPRGS
jgi:3-hydroxyacyl-CoA dehydrogenase/enoyl-CoA hydratase/3-hydroxybutyryl-CoA epimerase